MKRSSEPSKTAGEMGVKVKSAEKRKVNHDRDGVTLPENTVGRIYRLTLAAAIAASFALHIAVLWQSRWKIAAGYGDFIIFYTGAQIINDGKGDKLFNVELQNAYQAKFDVPQLAWPLPFNHAPYELILFQPLASLSYPIAHAIWSAISIVLLVGMVPWILRYVNSRDAFFLAAGLIAWFPTMEALRLGQDSILSTVLLLAVFSHLRQGRDRFAGMFLAFGLYKPQIVLPMAGVLLMGRRWHSLVAFGITGLVLAGISIHMVGFQGIKDLLALLESM